MLTNTILVVPQYIYSIMGPKTLFSSLTPDIIEPYYRPLLKGSPFKGAV